MSPFLRVIGLSLLAFGSGACADAAFPEPPRHVRVVLVGATIGPSKIDGTAWDGAGGALPTLAAGIARELGADAAQGIVVAHVAGELLTQTTRPDPYGYVEARVGGELLARAALPRGPESTDTLTPSWPRAAGLARVPLGAGTRIRVHLVDHDLDADDPIGDAEISAAVLRAALDSGRVFQVDVGDQTQGQVLRLGLSVVAD